MGEYFDKNEHFEFEKADWPATKNKEITSAYFEDIRKHMYLIENPDAGHYTDYSQTKNTQPVTSYDPGDQTRVAINYGTTLIWGGYKWYCIAADKDSEVTDQLWGMWNVNAVDRWESHKPPFDEPEGINPNVDEWVLFNEFWVLAPNQNFYTDWNTHSPTHICAQSRWGEVPDLYEFLYNSPAKEHLPHQTDPLLNHDGDGGNVNKFGTKDVERIIDKKIEFKKEYVEIIKNMGPEYVAEYNSINGTYVNTQYAKHVGQFGKNNLDPSPQLDNPDEQIMFEPKISAAVMNQLEFIINKNGSTIFRPPDEDYKTNLVAYQQLNDQRDLSTLTLGSGTYYTGTRYKYLGGVKLCIKTINSPADLANFLEDTIHWHIGRYEGHNPYVPITEIWWETNGSGWETMLKIIGSYDWWYDEDFPTTSQTFLSDIKDLREQEHNEGIVPTAYPDFNSDEIDKLYPPPIGTWRRCSKYSFGRIDGRETVDYDDTSAEKMADTRTRMRPYKTEEIAGVQVEIKPIGQDWIQKSYSSYHYWETSPQTPATIIADTYPRQWQGIFVDTLPDFTISEEDLEELKQRHDPSQIVSVVEYELYAKMLDDLREICLLTNIRGLEFTPLSRKYLKADLRYDSKGKTWDSLTDAGQEIQSYFNIVIPEDPDDWYALDFTTDDRGFLYTLGASMKFGQDIHFSYNAFLSKWYPTGTSEPEGSSIFKAAFKIADKDKNPTIIAEFVIFVFTFVLKVYDDKNYYDMNFDLPVGQMTLNKYANKIPVMIPITSFDDWFVLEGDPVFKYGTVPTDTMEVNVIDGSIVDAISGTNIYGSIYDWDLLPDTTFGEVNIKGLKQQK